jgi:hypothetical protein
MQSSVYLANAGATGGMFFGGQIALRPYATNRLRVCTTFRGRSIRYSGLGARRRASRISASVAEFCVRLEQFRRAASPPHLAVLSGR